MAFVALEYQAALEFASRGLTALWTGIARRPAQIQSLTALFLGPVLYEIFVRTQPFLKLNRILRHTANSLGFRWFHYAGATGSIAESGGYSGRFMPMPGRAYTRRFIRPKPLCGFCQMSYHVIFCVSS